MALTDIISNVGSTAQQALDTYLGTGTEYESQGAPSGGYSIAPGGAIPGLEAPNITITPANTSTSTNLIPTSLDDAWLWVAIGAGVFLIVKATSK